MTDRASGKSATEDGLTANAASTVGGLNLASSQSSTAGIDNPNESVLREELAEVRALARSLMATVQEVRSQAARSEMVRGAIDEVRADVRAASQAMMLAQPQRVTTDAATVAPRTGGCGPCGCLESGCCSFDIKIWQVRAAKPQIEPVDMGDIALPLPTINAMEVQLYFTVDDIGFLWPGLATTMDLRAEGGLPGGPGPWVVINRAVQRISIPRGTNVTKQLRVEIREHDEGIERSSAFKDELGEAVGTIPLDCCMERIYPPMPLDVYLNFGGEGRGMVQIAYYAERVCC